MGLPTLYSIQVPLRTHRLVQELWPIVENKPYDEHGGPLATTFLVAMAGPMITFPVERIKLGQKGLTPSKVAKSEGLLTEVQSEAINTVLENTALKETPFFQSNAWRFAQFKAYPEFRVSKLPDYVLEALTKDEAATVAANIPTKQWVSGLRNALAHASVTYLDHNGQQAQGAATDKIAFICQRGNIDDPDRYDVFRISRDDFRAFLDHWAQWLEQIAMTPEPGAIEEEEGDPSIET